MLMIFCFFFINFAVAFHPLFDMWRDVYIKIFLRHRSKENSDEIAREREREGGGEGHLQLKIFLFVIFVFV